jgi:hypothetical protein
VQKLFARLDSDILFHDATSEYRLLVIEPNGDNYDEPDLRHTSYMHMRNWPALVVKGKEW